MLYAKKPNTFKSTFTESCGESPEQQAVCGFYRLFVLLKPNNSYTFYTDDIQYMYRDLHYTIHLEMASVTSIIYLYRSQFIFQFRTVLFL
jgi:hypothetical protein